MTLPSAAKCLTALDATWPAKRAWTDGDWFLRDGAGGGKRVSAATPLRPDADPEAGEAAMRAACMTPLFRLGPQESCLGARLMDMGYSAFDHSLIYAASVTTLAAQPPAVSLFQIWPPLAIMREIWSEGGIGPARIDVMDRAAPPGTGFVARLQDRVAGVAFCGISDSIAMLHAVEIAPAYRRKGVATIILRGAAHWAQTQGAVWFSLAVTAANTPARRLYERAGLQIVTEYQYLQKD
ncbi:MAG: GNAT family N-acetyltransferase [Roseinatronobacter sp.]